MPLRRLSRRAKDLVCMRHMALCAYCGRDLCDAFEVDHINECCSDDREVNLVATCALCHAIKSRHVRLGRDWSRMRAEIDANTEMAQGHWRNDEAHEIYGRLPAWLRSRVSRSDARLYRIALRPDTGALDIEQFRYTPEHPRDRHSGLRGV